MPYSRRRSLGLLLLLVSAALCRESRAQVAAEIPAAPPLAVAPAWAVAPLLSAPPSLSVTAPLTASAPGAPLASLSPLTVLSAARGRPTALAPRPAALPARPSSGAPRPFASLGSLSRSSADRRSGAASLSAAFDGLNAREPGVSTERLVLGGVELTATVREGVGAPLIFVPGLAGDLVFDRQLTELLAGPEKRPLVVLHRRDYSPEGRPTTTPHPDPIALAAADLDGAIAHFSRRFAGPDGEPSRVVLLGHSLGATVINEFARNPVFRESQKLVAGVQYSNPFFPSMLEDCVYDLTRFIIGKMPWPMSQAFSRYKLRRGCTLDQASRYALSLLQSGRLAGYLPPTAVNIALHTGLSKIGALRWLDVPNELKSMVLTYMNRRQLSSLLLEMEALLTYPVEREAEAIAAIRELGWRLDIVGNSGDPFVPERSVRKTARRLGIEPHVFPGEPRWLAHAPMRDRRLRGEWNRRLETLYDQALGPTRP